MGIHKGTKLTDNPKCNDIKVRLDNETYDKLQKYCNNHNITKAESIRQGIKLLLDREN